VERGVVDREAAVKAGDALAEAYGIEGEFVDAHGKTQRTSDETKRSLLKALGAEISDEDDARSALDALERKTWLRVVPPVLVTPQLDTLDIPVTLPSTAAIVHWRLSLEDGAELSGAVEFATLDMIEARSLDDGRYEQRRLSLYGAIPFGYHRLQIDGSEGEMALIVTPGACVLPDSLRDRRGWGVAVQLYALRSARNWGIGDFGDLQRLAGILAASGADVIGLNPLHALFLDDPEHASPYSPQSRLLVNVLNIDVTAAPGFDDGSSTRDLVTSVAFWDRLAACRASSLVPYADVCDLKLSVLQRVFAGDAARSRSAEFQSFVSGGGGELRDGCLFQVLREHFTAQDPELRDWRLWPQAFHDPHTESVRAFEAEHREELRFQYWLQWVADEQLAGAAKAVATAGMRIGLYRDLAVGSDPNGVEAWSNPAAVVQTASVGAPPDILNPRGQNWGLPPFHPMALREEAYRSFIQLVRANMRHAGAIRIDHVMALQHLYFIPANASPADGGYVRYALDDLVGILALESMRNNCLVIGEDLGTVPAGFRERMAAANILSYRVLFFEKTEDGTTFLPPDAYPSAALAVVASHDLPTLRAWLDGSDITLRVTIGAIDESEAAKQRIARETDRVALVSALAREGLLRPTESPDDDAFVATAHAFLARSGAVLVMAQLDDIAGETDPVNVPTTTNEYPNWRRRISVSLEDLATHGGFIRVTEAFAAAGRGND
jgi:glycogen operon protein